jgi:murein DD-endopeptidase MepM/ murein hydrolase activator NlpD
MMSRQMARRVGGPKRALPVALIAAIGAVVVIGLIAVMVIFGAQRPRATGSPNPSATHVAGGSASASAKPTASPSGSAFHSAVPSPSQQPSGAPSPGATPTPGPSATPSTTPSPVGSVAPQSAADFDLEGQVIAIGFPLRADTEYHYRDNFLDRRTGPPDPYNHAKPVADGSLVRLHDGIDIYAPENEPVLAPFDGTIIDPETKWTPWEPDRYGLTVVVESDEPTTTGYTAVLVHLDRVWVAVGQHVTRGQVIGVLGRTGNAEDVRPQLHIELRAPFLIDWTPLGETRQVDAFNPYPSLVAADPNP